MSSLSSLACDGSPAKQRVLVAKVIMTSRTMMKKKIQPRTMRIIVRRLSDEDVVKVPLSSGIISISNVAGSTEYPACNDDY